MVQVQKGEQKPPIGGFSYTMFFIYILHSSSSDVYYVGYSSDYSRRLIEHNTQEKHDTYTAKHRPWIIAAAFECSHDEGIAMKIEKFIKKQKSRKLIELLIQADFVPTGFLASLVRVPMHRC